MVPKSLALAMISVLFTPAILACSCVETPPVGAALLQAKAVFVGEVEQISLKRRWSKKGEELTYEPRLTVAFAVDRSWKGVPTPRIEISTSKDSASCGFDFKLGERYLVFADDSRRGLAAGLCSRIAHLSEASADLAELGEPKREFLRGRLARIRARLRTRPVVEEPGALP